MLEFSTHCQDNRFSAYRGYYEDECYTFCIKYVALLMKCLVILYSLRFDVKKYDLVFWLLRHVKESAWRDCWLKIKMAYLGWYDCQRVWVYILA